MDNQRKQDFLPEQNKMIYEKSLKNCHVFGLHSIIFKEENGLFTRMFIANSDHVLWENQCKGHESSWGPLSLAVHPHRVDIEIEVVTGTVWNILFESCDLSEERKGEREQEQDKLIMNTLIPYKWTSYILNEDKKVSGFVKLDYGKIWLKNRTKLQPGDRLKMRSDQLHTVFIEKGQTASWYIHESTPTGGYNAVTFSNHDLTKWTPSNLYIPATRQQVNSWLEIAKIALDE